MRRRCVSCYVWLYWMRDMDIRSLELIDSLTAVKCRAVAVVAAQEGCQRLLTRSRRQKLWTFQTHVFLEAEFVQLFL